MTSFNFNDPKRPSRKNYFLHNATEKVQERLFNTDVVLERFQQYYL